MLGIGTVKKLWKLKKLADAGEKVNWKEAYPEGLTGYTGALLCAAAGFFQFSGIEGGPEFAEKLLAFGAAFGLYGIRAKQARDAKKLRPPEDQSKRGNALTGILLAAVLVGLVGGGAATGQAQTLAGFVGASADGQGITNAAGHGCAIIGKAGIPTKFMTCASWRGASLNRPVIDLVQGIFQPILQNGPLEVGAITGAGYTTVADGTFGLFDGGFAASLLVKETEAYRLKITGIFKARYSPGLDPDELSDRYGLGLTWEWNKP